MSPHQSLTLYYILTCLVSVDPIGMETLKSWDFTEEERQASGGWIRMLVQMAQALEFF